MLGIVFASIWQLVAPVEIKAPDAPFVNGAKHTECVVNGIDFGAENDQEYLPYAPESLLLNGGFESGGRYWRNHNMGLDVRNDCIVTNEAHSGRCCLNVNPGVTSHILAVKPGKWSISFWCKAPKNSKRGQVNVSTWAFNGRKGDPQGRKYESKRFPCTEEWTRQIWTFDWQETALTINLGGNALVDDVQISPAGMETPEMVNPFGLELRAQDGLGRAYCDVTKPIDLSLDVYGPAGTKGTLDISITDFFGRNLCETNNVQFVIEPSGGEGSRLHAIDGNGEPQLFNCSTVQLFSSQQSLTFPKGVFDVRVHVKPDGGHDFVDHLRFASFKFADGTAKNRMLHMIPANAATPEMTEYYRQMKAVGVVPRDNSCARTMPREWLDNPEKPPYWYRDWETMPERTKKVVEAGGCNVGWVYNNATRYLLKESGITNLAAQTSISESDAAKLEEAVARTVKMFSWIDVWTSPNEVAGHWTVVKQGKLEDYARALMAMQNGVRKANPKAVFLAYSTSNLSEQGKREIYDCFEAAQRLVPGYKFDAVDVHPYRAHPDNPDLDSDIDDFNRMLARLGYDKTFQICGLEGCYYFPFIMSQWNSIAPWAGTSQKDRFSASGMPGYSLGWGERISAAMHLRDKLILYKHGDQVKGGTAWGIDMLDAQHVMAPLVTTAAQTELLGNATFLEDVRFAPYCRAYIFDDHAGHAVAAFWRADIAYDRGRRKAETMMLAPIDGLEVFDLMGNNCSTIQPFNRSTQYTALPLSGFPVYLRVPIAKLGELAKALNSCEITGMQDPPVGFDFRMDGREKMRITAENILTRPFSGSYAFSDGVEHSLALAPQEKLEIEYKLDQPLEFGKLNRVEVPMTVSVGGTTVTNVYRLNALPVSYSSTEPDWSKLPLVKLEYYAQEVFSKARGESYGGEDDLSGGFKIAWNEEHLYLRYEVKDDVFALKIFGEYPGMWWSNDSIQMFFDTYGDGPSKKLRGITGFDGNDMSYDVMPTNETDAVVFRRHAPDHQLTGGVQGGLLRNVVEPGVSCKHLYDHEKHMRIVELDFPARLLRPMRLEEGSVPGFAVKVYDRDDPEVGNNKNGGAKGCLTNIDPRLGTAFGTMHEYAMLVFVNEE